jgi:hypothetical protein
MKYTGGNFNAHATAKAISGSRTICPTNPNNTAFGCLATLVNASLFKSIPSRNINTMRMGITIHIVFINGIFLRSFYCTCKSKTNIRYRQIETYLAEWKMARFLGKRTFLWKTHYGMCEKE